MGNTAKTAEIAEIRGRRRHLYLYALKLLATGKTQEEVATVVKIPQRTISWLKNRHLSLLNRLTLEYELVTKGGRLRHAWRIINKKQGLSKRDLLDWLEYARKEIEGDKPLVAIDLSKFIEVNYIKADADTIREIKHKNRIFAQ